MGPACGMHVRDPPHHGGHLVPINGGLAHHGPLWPLGTKFYGDSGRGSRLQSTGGKIQLWRYACSESPPSSTIQLGGARGRHRAPMGSSAPPERPERAIYQRKMAQKHGRS